MFAQIPHGVRCQVAHLVEARNRRHERPGAGRDHDALRCQRPAARGGLHFHRPGRQDFRGSDQTLDTEFCVSLQGVVGFDGLDHPRDALHHVGKAELRARRVDAEFFRPGDVGEQFGGTDQRLAGHAPSVQAVAAHAMFLDQRHLGLGCRGDVRRHKSGAAGADHDHVVVVTLRPRPFRIDPARLDRKDDLLCDQREQAEQHEREQQTGLQHEGERIDARQLRSEVHIDDCAGQHADLTHPVERARGNLRQPHHEVDHEERKDRHEP